MNLERLRSYYEPPQGAGTVRPNREELSDAMSAPRREVADSGEAEIVSHIRPTTLAQQAQHVLESRTLTVLSGSSHARGLPLDRVAFLDTETTGLGMGAGTYVFLVGVANVVPQGIRVRQIFLEGPQTEAPFLRSVAAVLSEFDALVTFNGKSFDWPLLESRFVRQRMVLRDMSPAHIDLLHPSRRLFRHRLPSCSLRQIERDVLGVERPASDVPGYQIPELYFRYLRSSNRRLLEPVEYHNELDVVSLVSLLDQLCRLTGDDAARGNQDAQQILAAGLMYERAGHPEEARAFFSNAAHVAADTPTRAAAWKRLAASLKRSRSWSEAVRTWEMLAALGGPEGLDAIVEIAKYYEHVERDLDRALQWVERALLLSDLRIFERAGIDSDALRHRQSRLIGRSMRREKLVVS